MMLLLMISRIFLHPKIMYFFVRCSSLIAVVNEIKMKFDFKSLSPRVSAFLVPEQFFWMLLALLADTIFFLASPCPAKGTSCNIFLFCQRKRTKILSKTHEYTREYYSGLSNTLEYI